jgi:hypothetical protein
MTPEEDKALHVSMRDYVDSRFRDQERATILALETVKVAMEKDDRKLSNLLAVVALVISLVTGVASLVYTHVH